MSSGQPKTDLNAFGPWDVRRATEDDIAPLCDLLSACIEDMRARGIDQWDEIYPTRATLLTDVQDGTMYVATLHAGDIIGSLVLNEHQDAGWANVDWTIARIRTAVVHRLMVHPASQHRGLATSLMRFAEQRAQALGYGAIRLDAFLKNPRALQLYDRLGYRNAGTVTLRKGPFRCYEKALADSEAGSQS